MPDTQQAPTQIDENALILAFIGAVIGAVISLFVGVFFQQPLEKFLARIFDNTSAFTENGSIRGKWKLKYDFEGRSHEHIIEFKQFRSRVWGETSADPDEYYIEGTYQNGIFVAKFKDLNPYSNHEGGIVARPEEFNRVLRGQWLGFDRENRTNSGDLTFER